MNGSLWSVPGANQNTETKHSIWPPITSGSLTSKVTRSGAGSRQQVTSAWPKVQGHTLLNYESKSNTFLKRSFFHLSQYHLEDPWASTFLSVTWGCQHQPLRTWKHSRNPSEKLILLCFKNNHVLPHCNGFSIIWFQGLQYKVSWTYTQPSFLLPVKLRLKFLFLMNPHTQGLQATCYFPGGSGEVGSLVEGLQQLWRINCNCTWTLTLERW